MDQSVLEPPAALPGRSKAEWKPLRRHRRDGVPGGGSFHRGWARIGWNDSALVFDLVLSGRRATNRARRLNELTHLLGDTAEIFIQCLDSDRYLEIHVTPENQRLQLEWNAGALERVRKGSAALLDFAVADPNWVESATRVTPSFWSVRAVVPAATVCSGRRRFDLDTPLLAAVCRYDYSDGEKPALSSTADFEGRPFHTRAAWHRLALLPD